MFISGYSPSLWAPLTYNSLNSIWLFMQTAADWICTISIWVLLRRRFEGNLQSVRQVMTASFQTAGFTSLLSLLGALTAAALPSYNGATANVNCAFSTPLTSLYALSLIVTLASRRDRPVVVVGTTLAGFQPDAFGGRLGTADAKGAAVGTEKGRSGGGGGQAGGEDGHGSEYGFESDGDEFGEAGEEDEEATAGVEVDDFDGEGGGGGEKQLGREADGGGWRLDVTDRVAVAVEQQVRVELRAEGDGEFRPSRRGSVEAAAAAVGRGESRSTTRSGSGSRSREGSRGRAGGVGPMAVAR